VKSAIARHGYEPVVSRDPDLVLRADKLFLPGVGTAAAFDNHNDARIFLQPFRIRFLILFQFKAQPGGAMNQTDNVLFAPNVAENILRQSLIFHLDFLL
jgi:hypothetical protein